MATYSDVQRWRRNIKQRLVNCFGDACAICKLKYDFPVYDFHHVDPLQKDFGLTARIRAWDTIIREAVKCVLLCSNCHRKVHNGLASVPKDAPRFDLSRLPSDEISIKLCPICQTSINPENVTCSKKCSALFRSKRDWSMVNFKGLLEVHKNSYQIAMVLGDVSDVTIRKKLRLLELID